MLFEWTLYNAQLRIQGANSGGGVGDPLGAKPLVEVRRSNPPRKGVQGHSPAQLQKLKTFTYLLANTASWTFCTYF